MSIEKMLLLRVVEANNFRPLKLRDITAENFNDPEARVVFDLISKYYHSEASQGDVPTLNYIRKRYPTFGVNIKTVKRSVDSLLNEFIDDKVRMSLISALDLATDTAETSPTNTLDRLLESLSKLKAGSANLQKTTFTNNIDFIREQYEMVKSKKGCLGIPYPWDKFTEVTMGIQNGEFIVIYGRPKSMKTWIMLQIAANAYLNHGKRVLFYSREMSEAQILQRLAASVSKIDYKLFKLGKLEPTEEAKFNYVLDMMQSFDQIPSAGNRKPFFSILTDRQVTKGGGVTAIKDAIERQDPDLVCVDAMYLMANDREGGARSVKWTNQSAITQDLKQLALQSDIPIIGTTQANRKGQYENMGTADIGFSDSYGQDADYILKVIKHKDYHKNPAPGYKAVKCPKLYIRVSGAREFDFEGLALDVLPAYYFREVGIFETEDELERALSIYKKAKANNKKKKQNEEPASSKILNKI